MMMALMTCLILQSCSNKNSELYIETDKFVNSLETTYDSYGILNVEKYAVYTKDSTFRIMPIGRLVNVRIEKEVDEKEYEDLKNNLKNHYEKDSRVNDVYICEGGTIMIDCRK